MTAFFCGEVPIKIMPIKIIVLAEYNPSVLTAKNLQHKNGWHIASRKQQSNSLCLAVNPPPFDKGGKFSAGDTAENLIDGADGEQSLR